MKKIVCWFLGHALYICEGCQQAFDLLFEGSKPSHEWKCQEADRCQNVCRRCGSREVSS